LILEALDSYKIDYSGFFSLAEETAKTEQPCGLDLLRGMRVEPNAADR